MTARDAFDLIPRLPAIWDEPFGDSSQIPTYLVSALSRQSVAVALSGDGADELFGGYSRFQAMERAWGSLRHLPARARSSLAQVIGIGSRSRSVPGAIGRAARILHSREFEALYRWRVSRVEHPDSLVLGSGAESSHRSGASRSLPIRCEKMLYADTLTYLPEDILTKVDRASMAVGLEVRAPFLDHRIVEFSWNLPMSQKLKGPTGKAILRSLGGRYLPLRGNESAEEGSSACPSQAGSGVHCEVGLKTFSASRVFRGRLSSTFLRSGGCGMTTFRASRGTSAFSGIC